MKLIFVEKMFEPVEVGDSKAQVTKRLNKRKFPCMAGTSHMV